MSTGFSRVATPEVSLTCQRLRPRLAPARRFQGPSGSASSLVTRRQPRPNARLLDLRDRLVGMGGIGNEAAALTVRE